MIRRIPIRSSGLLLAAALIVTALVYWPGMRGGFVFDDFPNIVDNAAIHVTRSTLANWANAAWASPASDFRRPLASLTFAINWYFGGGNPLPMKITNLAIHLLNGTLLFCMLRELLRAWNARGTGMVDEAAARRLILIVCVAWLLAPINLMAVLYVVQRMESLCQVFVLAGLWGYLRGRQRMLLAATAREGYAGFALAAASLVFGTAIGLLSKESAVLLPVYAFLAEWVLLRFRDRTDGNAIPGGSATSTKGGRVDRRIVWLFVFVLLLPAVTGLAWLLPQSLNPAAWASRSFTLGERLLTEARVLVKYLLWIVLPDPSELSVYHDEMPLSTGLFAPWTTLPSILFLAAFLGTAVWLRDRLPVIALGILWFFAAHLLTATFIPLELVYEHRNYFASLGVLLALFSILLGLRRTIALPILRGTVTALLLMWFASVTGARALDWSNPLRLALTEANRHPDSARANYEAGRLLIIESDYRASQELELSKFYLRRAAAVPGASTLPEQALIMIQDRARHGDDASLWKEMTTKLRAQPTAEEDISALISLTQCRTRNDCDFPIAPLKEAFLAALSRPRPAARLLAAYADFSRDLEHDNAAAVSYLRRATQRAPLEAAYRVRLAHLLLAAGQKEEALGQIAALRRMNSLGRLDAQIEILQRQARSGGSPAH